MYARAGQYDVNLCHHLFLVMYVQLHSDAPILPLTQ